MSKYTIKKQKYKYGTRLLTGFLSLNTLLCACTHTNHLLNGNEEANRLLHAHEEAKKAQTCIDRVHNVSLVMPAAVPFIVNEEVLNQVESKCNISSTEIYQRPTNWTRERIIKWVWVAGVGFVVVCVVSGLVYWYWPESTADGFAHQSLAKKSQLIGNYYEMPHSSSASKTRPILASTTTVAPSKPPCEHYIFGKCVVHLPKG